MQNHLALGNSPSQLESDRIEMFSALLRVAAIVAAFFCRPLAWAFLLLPFAHRPRLRHGDLSPGSWSRPGVQPEQLHACRENCRGHEEVIAFISRKVEDESTEVPTKPAT